MILDNGYGKIHQLKTGFTTLTNRKLIIETLAKLDTAVYLQELQKQMTCFRAGLVMY